MPNTLLMGWPWWWRDEPEKYVPELVSTINAATIHEKTLLLCHRLSSFPGPDEELTGFIDVWWILPLLGPFLDLSWSLPVGRRRGRGDTPRAGRGGGLGRPH